MTAKKQMNARIEEDLLGAVANVARERHETVTEVIEKAFRAYIQPEAPAQDVYTPPERKRSRKQAVTASASGPVEAVRALAEAVGAVPASQLARPARPPRCTHQGTRVIGGYCKECDRLVGPGGY